MKRRTFKSSFFRQKSSSRPRKLGLSAVFRKLQIGKLSDGLILAILTGICNVKMDICSSSSRHLPICHNTLILR